MRKIVLTLPSLCLQCSPSRETVTLPQDSDLKQNCTRQLKITVENNFKVVSCNMTSNPYSMVFKHSKFFIQYIFVQYRLIKYLSIFKLTQLL